MIKTYVIKRGDWRQHNVNNSRLVLLNFHVLMFICSSNLNHKKSSEVNYVRRRGGEGLKLLGIVIFLYSNSLIKRFASSKWYTITLLCFKSLNYLFILNILRLDCLLRVCFNTFKCR